MHSVRAPRSLCCPAPPCARATLMCSVAHALRLPRACAVRVPPVRSLCPPAPLVRSPCMVCVRLILCMPPDARASFLPVRPRAALCVHRPCASAPSRVSCTAASALLRVSFAPVRLCALARLLRPRAPLRCSASLSSWCVPVLLCACIVRTPLCPRAFPTHAASAPPCAPVPSAHVPCARSPRTCSVVSGCGFLAENDGFA